MNVKDKEVIKILKKIDSYELEDAMEIKEQEAGQTDMEALIEELEWLMYKFDNTGFAQNETLREAREIVRKRNYVWKDTGKPVYKESDVRIARDTINEYNRLKRLHNKLH